MNRIFNFIINSEYNGIRTAVFLKNRGFSGTIVKSLRHEGGFIYVNGEAAKTNTLLKTGDKLRIELFEETPSPYVIAVKIPLRVIYEDEDILVVDKPAGMAVHPSQGNHGTTLADAYAAHCPGGVFRCINRLDRNTSGLVLIAKNKLSAAILTVSMEKREIHREYFAVCEGISPKHGVIDAPIARVDGSTIARKVDFDSGDSARTHFERLSYGADYSAIRVWLDTGRTHQIRVHMSHIGHPLPGDFIYNPDFREINRTALHSRALSFTHPVTGAALSFTAPLPADFKSLLVKAEFSEQF